MVNSFYDPVTEEGCAFEELISFHGGLGGPQTQPFILHPAPVRAEPSRSSAPPRSTGSCATGARCATTVASTPCRRPALGPRSAAAGASDGRNIDHL